MVRMMNTKREQMMNNVCKRLGLEHKHTIIFCELCKDTTIDDSVIEDVYNKIMIMSYFTED